MNTPGWVHGSSLSLTNGDDHHRKKQILRNYSTIIYGEQLLNIFIVFLTKQITINYYTFFG